MSGKNFDRSLVVFASRETERIISLTLERAISAIRCTKKTWGIHVIVNGNAALAKELVEKQGKSINDSHGYSIYIWNVEYGDKANAWNAYIHQIWGSEGIAYFIDGYVRLRNNSLSSIEREMEAKPSSLGATGVPSAGRTAEKLRDEMLAHGGYHGNLCCMRGHVIAEMRLKGIYIPIDMYRVDSLLGAYLSFGLNPAEAGWDKDRILVVGDASWDVNEKKWWRYSDIRSKKNQLLRQSKGLLENAAIKYFLTKTSSRPESLPQDVYTLFREWKLHDPLGWMPVCIRNPISLYQWIKCTRVEVPASVRNKNGLRPFLVRGVKE